MSNKHKKICKVLSYIGLFLIPFSVVTGCISISAFKKIRNKLDNILLLAKTKLNSIEVLFSMVLIDSYLSHSTFLLVNNVLKE